MHMKPFVVMIGLALLFAEASWAEVKLGENTTVVFLSVEQGQQALGARDEFIERMSPFDRAARMKTDKEASEAEFLGFVKTNVLAWTEDDRKKVEDVFRAVQPALARLPVSFPKTIGMITTTGAEEGGAAYTRGTAMVIPKADLAAPGKLTPKFICHELFHILSRGDPKLRDRLYRAIGFEKCGEVEFPPALRPRKITNPDAPRNDHCIRVQVDGKPVWVAPILFSQTEKYDVRRGGEFFNYLQFQLLAVARGVGADSAKPVYAGQSPVLLWVNKVGGFFDQVGQNTEYIIHPEEILADNFALLALEQRDIVSPEILKKIRAALPEPQAAGQGVRPETNKPPRPKGTGPF
jgi:hypothetical protein